MARKKKNQLGKRIIIIGLVLTVLQIGVLVFLKMKTEPPTVSDAIAKAADKVPDIDAQRREQIKIQLALADYQSKNKGKFPDSLDVLVPTYFEAVPKDPATGKAFPYKVANGRYQLGEALPPKPKPGVETGPTIGIDGISPEFEAVKFIYDPNGKRDPFLPFNFAPLLDQKGLTPLERYDIVNLRLTAVLKGFDEPTAFVENAEGKGFPVKVGTLIGRNSGKIVAILNDRLVIEETSTDFTGTSKTERKELILIRKEK